MGNSSGSPSGDLPRPSLGVWDAVSIIIGIVIGVGIHETAPTIFAVAGAPWAAVGCWVAGGILSLVGALCFAELATSLPHAGGDYHYLKHAFGRWAGYLFGWLHLAILKPASIGMMVFIFANYAGKLTGNGSVHILWPALATAALVAINLAGLALGKGTQNTLVALKVLGFGGIIVSGLVFGKADIGAGSPTWDAGIWEIVTGNGIGLAMVFVLYAYGGWNDAALVSSEIRNPKKNLPRALLLSIGLITVIYALVNLAYLRGVGFEQARSSKAIAADVLALSLGSFGYNAMCILVMVSSLGAANGIVFAGSRIYTALGKDFAIFERIGRRDPRSGTPSAALLIEGSITITLILLVGTETGRGWISSVTDTFGFGEVKWAGRAGFDTLLTSTAPYFWILFLMSGVSLFILRHRRPDLERPFKVPLYPFTPLLFCLSSAYMIYRASSYAQELMLLGAIPLALGIPFFFFRTRGGKLQT